MAVRQRITDGAILEIPLNNGYFAYCQILRVWTGGYAFFNYRSREKLKDLSILNDKEILFITGVYDDVINKGFWLKVGKIPIREELKIQPMRFIYHKGEKPEFELYNPNTGEITPSTKVACKGLEVAAVHDANHIEERLNDYFEGKLNAYRQEKLDLFKD